MGAWELKCTDDVTGNIITYNGDNIVSCQIDYNTPVTPMPLPQSEDTKNILIKVEGNSTTVNLSWKIRNLGANPFSGTSRLGNTGTSGHTAIEIVEFFKTDIVPVTVSDSFELTIADVFVLQGTLQKVNMAISSQSPVVWTATISFINGNVASSADPDLAEAPQYSGMASTTGTTRGVIITSTHTDSFGSGDSTITGYKVQYRPQGTDTWSNFSTVTYSGGGGAGQSTAQYHQGQ